MYSPILSCWTSRLWGRHSLRWPLIILAFGYSWPVSSCLLEYELDLMTSFQWIEYGKSDKISLWGKVTKRLWLQSWVLFLPLLTWGKSVPYHEAVHVVRDRGLLAKKSELGSRFSSPSQTLGWLSFGQELTATSWQTLSRGLEAKSHWFPDSKNLWAISVLLAANFGG